MTSRANAATLSRLTPMLALIGGEAKARFGGYHLYHDGRFFGLVASGRLCLRTDAESRPDYLARGMDAFQPAKRPRGPKAVDRNFRVPDDVLADGALLAAWALRAAAAQRD